jgi:transposase
VGLVPKQNSSGGKLRLGNISKQGDRYLRSLFTTYFNRRMVEQHRSKSRDNAPGDHGDAR